MSFDLIQQGNELARRRKLVEAMQASAMKDSELAGSGQGNILHALTGWLGEGRASEKSRALGQEEADYRSRYAEALRGEADRYIDTSQGTPGDVMPAAELGGGPVRPATSGNPREAMIRAMTSQFPEMQELGQASFKTLGKPQEIKQHVVNGQLVEGVPGGAQRVAWGGPPAKDEFGPLETITGADGKPVQGQYNKRTGEFHVKGGGGQTINVGDKTDAALLSPALEAMKTSRGTILAEQKNLDAAERIYTLSQDPQLISGPGADPLMFLSSVGAKLGFNGPEASAKTQAMLTDLAGNALARGQEMKGSFSDADIKFLQDVTAGRISASPQVMREVAALAYAASHNSILAANQQYSGSANLSEATRKASAMYPMPAIKHKNLDPNLFTDEEGTGRMRYNSVLRKPAASPAPTSSGSGVKSWRDWKG